MSRTEGIHLPRLPTGHAKAVSPGGMQPLLSPRQLKTRFSPLTEPNYTAYIGTPRQDLPQQVYCDAAMFDDVFDKQGRLLSGRNTVKITSPLTSQQYNSLHDPHCRKLFLNNCTLREHLINLGLLTEDLRVVASTQEQRQRIRAHELLERKEQLIKKLEEREQRRIAKLQKAPFLPYLFTLSLKKDEERIKREREIERMKMEKLARIEQDKREKEMARKRERKRQLQQLLEQINLWDQTKRNAARAQQEIAEMSAYEKQFGWTASWHRDSDRIHNRMVFLSRTKWAEQSKQKLQGKKKKLSDQLSESFPKVGSTQSSSPRSSPRLTPAPERTSPASEPQLPLSSEQQDVTTTEAKEISREEEASGKEGLEEWMLDETEEEGKHEQEKEEPSATVLAKKGSRHERSAAQAMPTEPCPHSPIEEAAHTPTDDKEPSGETVHPTTLEQSTRSLLNTNRSAVELSRFFTDILASADLVGNGFISLDRFVQIFSSGDLGLPLDQEEVLYIAGQVDIYGNGWIPVIQVASILPGLITVLLQQRMQLELEHYGQFIEERWSQLQSQTVGIIYLDKTTGLLQRERPSDFRPYLRDSPFEEMIVELFNSADLNQDGYVDSEEFVEFTQSPLVSGRIYTEQAKEVIEKFAAEVPPEGYMSLEQFVPITELLISMIYKNSYPTQEWLELQSPKFGSFLYNPTTGETKLQEQPEQNLDLSQSSQPSTAKRKKRRRRRRVSAEESGGIGGPPPLRPRSLSSRESTRSQKGLNEERSISIGEEEKEDHHSPVEEGKAETLVQEVAKQLQAGLRIIEAIPEEREEDLEASSPGSPRVKQPQVGPVGAEQQTKTVDGETLTNNDITEENEARVTENSSITENKTGLEEVDTINRVLGEVIAKRKQAQANNTQ